MKYHIGIGKVKNMSIRKNKVITKRIVRLMGLVTFGIIMAGLSPDFNDLSGTIWQTLTASLIGYGNIHNASTFTDEKCIVMMNAIKVRLNETSKPEPAANILANIYCNNIHLQSQAGTDLEESAIGVVA